LTDTQRLELAAAELVARAQSGDAAALEGLLTVCRPAVRRWTNVLVTDQDDADDVTQEVLIRVSLRLHRFAGRARFTTWLYQVTRNTALWLRRRIAARLRLVEGWRRVDQAPALATTAVERAQLGTILERLFHALPLRQREILYLVDIEGWDAGEVAGRLGLRRTTVRAHLFRARHAVRAQILEHHPEIAEEYRP
jgi:RNA polymerase sigma-70 factor, ECF subfamily